MNEIDKYILNFDIEIQDRLNSIRQIFFETFPNAKEAIRYNMLSFKIENQYFRYAAYKKYIGFYAIYELEQLENELSIFRAKGTKDTLHFMHNKTLPLGLIEKIIKLKFKNNQVY